MTRVNIDRISRATGSNRIQYAATDPSGTLRVHLYIAAALALNTDSQHCKAQCRKAIIHCLYIYASIFELGKLGPTAHSYAYILQVALILHASVCGR